MNIILDCTAIWEELDAMSDLPRITITTDEIMYFLQALAKQQEQQKLFQFLNGLNKEYSAQRSHIDFASATFSGIWSCYIAIATRRTPERSAVWQLCAS